MAFKELHFDSTPIFVLEQKISPFEFQVFFLLPEIFMLCAETYAGS